MPRLGTGLIIYVIESPAVEPRIETVLSTSVINRGKGLLDCLTAHVAHRFDFNVASRLESREVDSITRDTISMLTTSSAAATNVLIKVTVKIYSPSGHSQSWQREIAQPRCARDSQSSRNELQTPK